MFFVRSQVRHTGFELTQTDDARLLAPQITRFENTQPLAYHPRRSPAEFSYQICKPLPRSVVQPGLNGESHALIVLQDAICMTYRNSHFGAGRWPAQPSNLAREDLGVQGGRRTSENSTTNFGGCQISGAGEACAENFTFYNRSLKYGAKMQSIMNSFLSNLSQTRA